MLYGLGMALSKITVVLMGLVISAKYANCDPLVTQKIRKSDEILPYYVKNVTKNMPGILGLFTAGITTGSLRLLSCYISLELLLKAFRARPI